MYKKILLTSILFLISLSCSDNQDNSQTIENELSKQGKKVDNLVITFHGMQKRRIVNKGDDYYRHCYETFCLIKNNLKNIRP